MNRKVDFNQIIHSIAGNASHIGEARHLIKEMAAVLQVGLMRDGFVELNGLGTFKLTNVSRRVGKNIRTGEDIILPAHKKVLFKPERHLRHIVNKKYEHLKPQKIDHRTKQRIEDAPEQKSNGFDVDIFQNYTQKQVEQAYSAQPFVEPEAKPTLSINMVESQSQTLEPQTAINNVNWHNKYTIYLGLFALLVTLFGWFINQKGVVDSKSEAAIPPTITTEKKAVEILPKSEDLKQKDVLPLSPNGEESPTNSKKTEKTKPLQIHNTKRGDSLWKLAQNYLGDGYKWPLILLSNRENIPNPDYLKAGISLQIPFLPKSSENLDREMAKAHIAAYKALKKRGDKNAYHHLFSAKEHDINYIKTHTDGISVTDLNRLKIK